MGTPDPGLSVDGRSRSATIARLQGVPGHRLFSQTVADTDEGPISESAAPAEEVAVLRPCGHLARTVSRLSSARCSPRCAEISRTSSSISTSAGSRGPTTSISRSASSTSTTSSIHLHRPMALAAPDDGGARRCARQGQCRGHRLRRPLFREGSAERRSSRPAPGRGHGADEAVALPGAGGRRRSPSRTPFRDRPVVLGTFLTPTHNGSQASLTTKAGFSFVGDPPTDFVTHFNGVLAPIPELADAAAGWAFSTGCRTTTASSVVCRCCSTSTARSSRAWRWRRFGSRRARPGYIVKSTTAYGSTAGKSEVIDSIKDGDVVIPLQADGQLRVWFAKSDPRRSIPGLESASARRRSFRPRRQDRLPRRERYDAVRHRGDPARSVDAGRRGARPADRADPVRRDARAARLGAGRGIRRRRGVVAGAGGAAAVHPDLLRRRSWASSPPAAMALSAGTPSSGTAS